MTNLCRSLILTGLLRNEWERGLSWTIWTDLTYCCVAGQRWCGTSSGCFRKQLRRFWLWGTWLSCPLWTSLRKMLWSTIISSSTAMDIKRTGPQKQCLSLSNADVFKEIVFPQLINFSETKLFQHPFFLPQTQAEVRRTHGSFPLVEEATL